MCGMLTMQLCYLLGEYDSMSALTVHASTCTPLGAVR